MVGSVEGKWLVELVRGISLVYIISLMTDRKWLFSILSYTFLSSSIVSFSYRPNVQEGFLCVSVSHVAVI